MSYHIPRALKLAILRLVRLNWNFSASRLGKICLEGAQNFGQKPPVEFVPYDQKILASLTVNLVKIFGLVNHMGTYRSLHTIGEG